MQENTELVVTARWDDEAEVWVAESDDVPGLATEAESLEGLAEKLKYLVPELLDLNGAYGLASTPINLKAERIIRDRV